MKVSIPQGNREESLGFLNEVRDAASILVNLPNVASKFLTRPGSFCSGNGNPKRGFFRKQEYLRASARKCVCTFFSRRIHRLRLTLVQSCRLSLLQNVPTLSQTEAPHLHIPQARTWKLSGNISPRLILLQRRREVVMEPSDRYMQIANPLIDFGPTPAYQEGKEMHCI
jgi:hypothetical protein